MFLNPVGSWTQNKVPIGALMQARLHAALLKRATRTELRVSKQHQTPQSHKGQESRAYAHATSPTDSVRHALAAMHQATNRCATPRLCAHTTTVVCGIGWLTTPPSYCILTPAAPTHSYTRRCHHACARIIMRACIWLQPAIVQQESQVMPHEAIVRFF